jgi:hypothetical protein
VTAASGTLSVGVESVNGFLSDGGIVGTRVS